MVLQLQKNRSCSNYRIYTDLKLNPGNVNCWLKHGDSDKVSYQTAKRIVDYVLRYDPRKKQSGSGKAHSKAFDKKLTRKHQTG